MNGLGCSYHVYLLSIRGGWSVISQPPRLLSPLDILSNLWYNWGMMNIAPEFEVLAGVPLYVDHIKKDAFLKDPRFQVPYEKAVQCVERLQLKCAEIVTDTLFRYETPPSNRLTVWQKQRLFWMVDQGFTASEIAVKYGVSEEAVMELAGKEIEAVQRKLRALEYKRLAEYYQSLYEKEISDDRG